MKAQDLFPKTGGPKARSMEPEDEGILWSQSLDIVLHTVDRDWSTVPRGLMRLE